MNSYVIRDVIDCAVKVWSILYFSDEMEKNRENRSMQALSMGALIAFVLLERYVLNQQTIPEAFARNIVLYLLTCGVMLTWRKGQRQYLIFLASIVFFLWGGWLKLFTPMVFASLHLPTFGYPVTGAFPIVPVTIAENICRVLCLLCLKNAAFDIQPDREITAKAGFMAMIPVIIDHVTVLILYYLTVVAPSSEAEGVGVELTLLTLMLVFGRPCMLAATEQLFQLQRRELMLVRMENQMKQQVAEFERQRLSDEQARRIYHDLSKHLSVLEGMRGAGETRAYLDDMRRSAASVTPSVHTGNAVLDTLLSQKEAECARRGIALECMVDFKDADFIRYMDIVTMFANAVDNAMEAVEALPPERRTISLSAGTIGAHLLVKCQNPYAGERKKRRDGLFATSKREAALHGIGLGNLKRIVESYGGLLHVDDSNGLFVVQWMIPLPVAA